MTVCGWVNRRKLAAIEYLREERTACCVSSSAPSASYSRTRSDARIVGAMKNLGFSVGRMTVARLLAEHGIDPAPNRAKGMSWSAFLRAHWGAIAATDFFTVEVLTLTGLARYHVLFVIELKTRVVHIRPSTIPARVRRTKLTLAM